MRKYKAIALFLAVSAVSVMMEMTSGCSLFSKESRVSPQRFFSACDEYDSEEYESISELEDELDNKRALIAGMYIKAEGKEMRHVVESDALEECLSDIGNDVFYDLYSKNAESMTAFIQSEEEDDKGKIIFAGVSVDLGNEDDAWKYYRKCNERFSDTADQDEDTTKTLDYASDDKLECTVTVLLKRRQATVYSAYIDGDSVLVLIGYEYRNNGLDDYFDEFCEIMDIPAPDLSDIDTASANDEVEDRFMTAVDYLDAEEIDPEDFAARLASSPDVDVIYYITDEIDVSGFFVPSIDPSIASGITEMRVIYESSRSSRLIGNYLMITEYKTEDKTFSEEIYNTLTDSLSMGGMTDVVDSGERDGISFFKASLSDHIFYSVYRENESVYIVATTNDGSDEISDVMGLP
ncbi:MAG: hypothetical protein K6A80_08155 [Saccharofermentans sp.]|nr:hypothetical protein [Saccharofermentans sp.]